MAVPRFVSVRRADRDVVMDLAHDQRLRACELEVALAESRADMAAGRLEIATAEEHSARAQVLIAAEAPAGLKLSKP